MKNYRRNRQAGATYFFTLCLDDRRSSLLIDYIDELRKAYQKTQSKLPFTTEAMVILPDHIHALWTMPNHDDDYPTRIRLFKSHFSRQLPQSVKRTSSVSRMNRQETGVWQRRFWEHTIRDELDFNNHMDYIHYNPVKHKLVSQAADWAYSSFLREVKKGRYAEDWATEAFDNSDIGE